MKNSFLLKQMEARVGLTLGNKYFLEEIVGWGGMGVVYKAVDTYLDRNVAVKIIHPHLLYPNFRERFEIEAQSIAKLEAHPNILQIYEYNPDAEECYIVTRYLKGETLENLIQQHNQAGTKMPEDAIVNILRGICSGLAFVHTKEIIHRDIKPSNLMITESGEIIIMDFGLAKSVKENSELTQTGTVIGTDKYLSPERLIGDEYDHRSDIYSLGVLLYKTLTGTFPFEATNAQKLRELQLNKDYPDIRSLNPQVSEFLIKITKTCLDDNPYFRYSSATEIINNIEIHNREDETTIISVQTQIANIEDEEPENDYWFPPGEDRSVYYDHQTEINKFADLLDELANTFHLEKYQKALSPNFVKAFRENIAEIKKSLDSDFNLVIIGDFKRGKSSLINAILENNVVTIDPSPETVTINQINYGKTKKISACLPNGGIFPLHFDELKREKLEKVMLSLPEAPDCLKIEYPAELLKGIQLVDTPGLNDFIGGFESKVTGYLQKADAVIHVISAASPLSLSERTFLKQSLKSFEFSKICFVINQIDKIDEHERAKVIDSVSEKLYPIFPNSKLFAISARNELRRLKGDPKASVTTGDEVAEFAKFKNYLKETIFLNRRLLQIERTITRAKYLLNKTRNEIERLNNILSIEVSEIENAILECENQNSKLRTKLKAHQEAALQEIRSFGSETVKCIMKFIDRLKDKVIENLSDFDYQDIQKHLPFFISEQIDKAITACFDYHQALILEKLGETTDVLKDVKNKLEIAGKIESSSLKSNLEAIGAGEWNILQEVTLVLGQSSGILQRMLTGFIEKNLNTRARIVEYRANLINALPELKQAVEKEIHTLYENVASKCMQSLENMYQQQLDSALISLKQAQVLQKTGEENLLLTGNVLHELNDYLESADQQFVQINERIITNHQKYFDELD